MGLHTVDHDPCDPSKIVTHLTHWPMTHWPIACSESLPYARSVNFDVQHTVVEECSLQNVQPKVSDVVDLIIRIRDDIMMTLKTAVTVMSRQHIDNENLSFFIFMTSQSQLRWHANFRWGKSIKIARWEKCIFG